MISKNNNSFDNFEKMLLSIAVEYLLQDKQEENYINYKIYEKLLKKLDF